MEIDLEETIKGLLLKNIVIQCKLDTLLSCLAQLISDQKGIEFDAAIAILNTVCNGFIEKQNSYNPLFQDLRNN